jgi:hypothetical protein
MARRKCSFLFSPRVADRSLPRNEANPSDLPEQLPCTHLRRPGSAGYGKEAVMKYLITIIVAFHMFIGNATCQESTPIPNKTPIPESVLIEEHKALVNSQKDLIKAQRELIKEYTDAFGTTTITRDTAGGKTAFKVDDKPMFEVIDLTYQALAEIASKIGELIRPHTSKYDRVVIFDERDFAGLSRLRLYREEAKIALANVEKLMREVEDYAAPKKGVLGQDREKEVNISGVQGGGRSPQIDPLITAFSMPQMAGAAIRSVAEVISLFRSETEISESKTEIDQRTVNAAVAGVVLKDSKLKVYDPAHFVPEYELGTANTESFYNTVGKLRRAMAVVTYLEEAAAHATPQEKNDPKLARLLASIRMMKRQLDLLSFSVEPDPIPQKENEKADLTEFRAMVRAEQLDKFMTGGSNVGILKVKVLSSGGSRRERKNLMLGTRNDYSGSAVVEFALYDLDGTPKLSEIVRHHTGFRKYDVKKAK